MPYSDDAERRAKKREQARRRRARRAAGPTGPTDPRGGPEGPPSEVVADAQALLLLLGRLLGLAAADERVPVVERLRACAFGATAFGRIAEQAHFADRLATIEARLDLADARRQADADTQRHLRVVN